MQLEARTYAKTGIETAAVQLNAIDPKELVKFYRTKIGLTFLREEDGAYIMGTQAGRPLLEIYPTVQKKKAGTTGLYHFALLLPERSDLGAILQHLIQEGVSLTGASDHGYSEAIYLDDPEGNGIEIYVDKDRSEWDIKDNGLIAGVVEPMDVEGVLASAKERFTGLPNETVIGHIHLHVDDLLKSFDFYQNYLGLGLRYIMNWQAMFLATGDSHHHLGMNLWNGVDIDAADSEAQGLRASVWKASPEDAEVIREALEDGDYDYTDYEDCLQLYDPAGTQLIIRIEEKA